jgi:hypothetical protein
MNDSNASRAATATVIAPSAASTADQSTSLVLINLLTTLVDNKCGFDIQPSKVQPPSIDPLLLLTPMRPLPTDLNDFLEYARSTCGIDCNLYCESFCSEKLGPDVIAKLAGVSDLTELGVLKGNAH